MRLLALLLLTACTGSPEPPPAPTTSAPADGLDRVVALARACVTRDEAEPVGQAGTPLTLDAPPVLQPDGGAWTVTFSEQNPPTAPYGRSVRVEPDSGRCDGVDLDLDLEAAGPSLAALTEHAWACAEQVSDAQGVGDSSLVRDSLRMHRTASGELIASFQEQAPTTRPSGRDLRLGRDGSACGPAAMD